LHERQAANARVAGADADACAAGANARVVGADATTPALEEGRGEVEAEAAAELQA
jgi:hypothetical protein